MRTRVGSLGLLLVLVMASGAVAQSPSPETSPSTEASPLLAPDELSAVLPSEIGGVAMTVKDIDMAETMATTADDNYRSMQNLFILLDVQPRDVRMATASTTDAYAPEQYNIVALQVPGMAADLLLDRLLRVRSEPSGQTFPPDYVWPMTIVSGRAVFTDSLGEEGQWRAFYPKGEVLFVVVTLQPGSLSMEDVLAELP